MALKQPCWQNCDHQQAGRVMKDGKIVTIIVDALNLRIKWCVSVEISADIGGPTQTKKQNLRPIIFKLSVSYEFELLLDPFFLCNITVFYCQFFVTNTINQAKSMKLNRFKIRKANIDDSDVRQGSAEDASSALRQSPIEKSLKFCQENMVTLMSMFEKFMKMPHQKTKGDITSSVGQAQQHSRLQYQTRDRHIIFQLPDVQPESITSSVIERWVTDVCMGAFSSSFNYYLTEQMTFEQAKVFCSETILANLMRFTEKYKLKQQQLELINKHLSSKVLEYLQKKYPLTLTTDVNKNLEKELQQTNNFEQLANDFLYSNKLIFKYRENGNYNDMIMKVINKTLEIVDGDSQYYYKTDPDDEVPSSYEDFQQYIGSLFNKVYDQDWINGKKFVQRSTIGAQSKIFRSENKEKYYEKVKLYTNYLIGRKMSQNTPQFTEQEINSNNLQIRNPATLRILTKWCEQLWQKFEKESYYSERAEPLLLEDPQFINPFFKWMRQGLDELMNQEKTKILQFKKKLDSHYNLQESIILLKYLQQEDSDTFIPKLEKAYGMFATHMVRNLRSYIILYLNRLIHGILQVSKTFFQTRVRDNKWNGWHAPPNLVTFKIGDLMRCKCSSKQKEIIKIYRQIMKRSDDNPEKLKIVRIKNRLREGTNDILINVKFNNSIICEIQLQVNNKSKSKFIQCSNAFSHYIYQLKRSIFGPITQMCNIWNNYDARASTFDKLVNKPHISVNSSEKIVIPQCKTEMKHVFQPYNLPFQCSLCKKLYFHNNYIFSNKSCKNCQIFWCTRCQLKQLSNDELKNKIFKTKKVRAIKNAAKKLQNTDQFPSQGACVKIESSEIKVQLFDFNKVQSKDWLFGCNQKNEVYEIFNVRTPFKIKQFFRQYLVFQLNAEFTEEVKELISENEQKIFAIGQYINNCYKQDKQVLIFTQIDFQYQQMNQLMSKHGGSERERKKIHRIQIAGNYLKDAAFFAPFDNLRQVNLEFNSHRDIKYITCWPKLQQLEIGSNGQLDNVPQEIALLQDLQYLKLSECIIATLPQNFGNLKNLQILKLEYNRLTTFPQSFWQLSSLKQLNLSSNQIQQLPDKLHKMQNLKKLKIGKNRLKELPQSITELVNLVYLNAQSNSITKLPGGMQALQKLQKIQLNDNAIGQQIPEKSFEIPSLQQIFLSNNRLPSFKCDLSKCKNLLQLELHNNKITVLTSTIGNCQALSNLTLQTNQLVEIPSQISNCIKLLKKLDFKYNHLKQFPAFAIERNEPFELDLSFNRLESLPEDMQQLQFAQTFNVSGNKIKNIPDSFISMKEATSFDFRDNQIEKIPNTILWFDCVKQHPQTLLLKFSGNKISHIEDQFFTHLKYAFKFCYNSLVQLPLKKLLHKQKLRSIKCDFNNIKQIPRQIKEFINLQKLTLNDNLIEVIPQQLSELKSIQYDCLVLHYNPWKNVQCNDFVQEKGSYQTRYQLATFNSTGPIQKVETQRVFYIDDDNYLNQEILRIYRQEKDKEKGT